MKTIMHNEPVRRLFNPQMADTYHGVTIVVLIVTLWKKCGIHIEFYYDYKCGRIKYVKGVTEYNNRLFLFV